MNDQMKAQGWVARDEDGELWLYADDKPYKKSQRFWGSDGRLFFKIDSNLFPSVKWEDAEPTEVKITIKIKQA